LQEDFPFECPDGEARADFASPFRDRHEMMFMMPMPPTSRLTAATALSKPVSTRVVPESIVEISLRSMTLKLSSWLVDKCRRTRIKAPISILAFRWTRLFDGDLVRPTSSLPADPRWKVRNATDDGHPGRCHVDGLWPQEFLNDLARILLSGPLPID